jgi:hypothetical protein
LWNKFLPYHNCTTVMSRFWLDIKEQVFASCEDKYVAFLYECKEVAIDFVLEQYGDCSTSEDCVQFGIGAFTWVAFDFCIPGFMPVEDSGVGPVPRKCEKHSIANCQANVIREVERFMSIMVCGLIDHSPYPADALDYIDDLHLLCIKNIGQLIEALENELILQAQL